MGPEPAHDPDELVDVRTAADMLGVEEDRIRVLVSDGVLDPVADRPGPVFVAADVAAARQMGG